MWIDDQVLLACNEAMTVKCWVPERPTVVLGRGNKVAKEVKVRACIDDGIPIVKRLGGGGTVILHQGCLIISLGLWVKDFYANDRYFKALNSAVIDGLKLGLPAIDFGQRGFSDIVSGIHKCAGTSLFRSRNYLLYQASILVDMQLELIETYLAHPSAEPDYRKARTHRDFLVDLKGLGQGDLGYWQNEFKKNLPAAIEAHLLGELIESQPGQVPHVLGRVGEEWLQSEEILAALNLDPNIDR